MTNRYINLIIAFALGKEALSHVLCIWVEQVFTHYNDRVSVDKPADSLSLATTGRINKGIPSKGHINLNGR